MAFGKVTLPPESCNVVTWKMTLNHTMHLVHGNIFEELSVKNLDKLPICDLFATCSSIQDAGNSRECLIDLKNTREANNNLLDLLVVCILALGLLSESTSKPCGHCPRLLRNPP
jgi:hypothetical protein